MYAWKRKTNRRCSATKRGGLLKKAVISECDGSFYPSWFKWAKRRWLVSVHTPTVQHPQKQYTELIFFTIIAAAAWVSLREARSATLLLVYARIRPIFSIQELCLWLYNSASPSHYFRFLSLTPFALVRLLPIPLGDVGSLNCAQNYRNVRLYCACTVDEIEAVRWTLLRSQLERKGSWIQ